MGFPARYNHRFAVLATQPGSAYRQPWEEFNLDRVLCFKYRRTVGLDNVVRFGEHRLQIMPTNGRRSYARARVELHERMDGSLAVYYQGQCLATKAAPLEAPVLRARSMPRVIPNSTDAGEAAGTATMIGKALRPKSHQHKKPGPDHSWRRPFKMHINKDGDKFAEQLR